MTTELKLEHEILLCVLCTVCLKFILFICFWGMRIKGLDIVLFPDTEDLGVRLGGITSLSEPSNWNEILTV